MTITPELEAAARAIYLADALPNEPLSTSEQFDNETRACRSRYLAMARAALLAIREPTDGMANAMVEVPGYEGNARHAKEDFRAVIDYILGATP